MRIAINVLTVTLFMLISYSFAADSAPEVITKMVTPVKLIFSDELKTGFNDQWKVAKGKWEHSGDGIKVAELKEDMHGAAARHTITFSDCVVKFNFKLEGAKSISLSFNGTKGHICRVAVKPNGFSVIKDNQDKKAGDKAINLQNQETPIKTGEWHSMVVELRGPDILATLDGKVTAFGTHPAIDKEKANFGFTVSGEIASFRDIKLLW